MSIAVSMYNSLDTCFLSVHLFGHLRVSNSLPAQLLFCAQAARLCTQCFSATRMHLPIAEKILRTVQFLFRTIHRISLFCIFILHFCSRICLLASRQKRAASGAVSHTPSPSNSGIKLSSAVSPSWINPHSTPSASA